MNNSYITAARGKERIKSIERLPVLDSGSEIRYFGSISKCGDNADWDWGMYQDNNGEWVLAEADGPGCIFNFTQHRYPTSPTPVFRFYFDGHTVPDFEITPPEFGTKAPFLKPLADCFIGPEDNGRGPIHVVRSFVPMEFKNHCKVTSSIRLEGCEKSEGQGGWGHVILHLYDRTDGLECFSASDAIASDFGLSATDTQNQTIILSAGETMLIFGENRKNTMTHIGLKINDFRPELLHLLRIRISFDGAETVYAPIGTFFGCEYGKSPADLSTALLSWRFDGQTAAFENRFPMPYFESIRISLENRSAETIIAEYEVETNSQLRYSPETTGVFSSSAYLEKRENTPGQNTVVGEFQGRGHMVYGVITGEAIENAGCEGDVRVFVDGLSSPSLQSDGTESWGSYGWGFVVPPQSNPFSAYHGLYGVNSDWSELRLTFTDCYPFKSSLRFELEHGETNNGGGKTSGQLFGYLKKKPCESFLVEITPDSNSYFSDGTKEIITNRFENGIHENYFSFTNCRDMTFSSFRAVIPPNNQGLVLKRVCLQDRGFMCAAISVDGIRVAERDWLYPDQNEIYSLLEDSFTIPAKYTSGKSEIIIEIHPVKGYWSECRYQIFAIIKR